MKKISYGLFITSLILIFGGWLLASVEQSSDVSYWGEYVSLAVISGMTLLPVAGVAILFSTIRDR